MTNRQKLELRASEIRTRLAELGGLDTLTDEHTTELDNLRNEYTSTEKRCQALAIAEDAPVETKTEDRAYAELVGAADLGAIFEATLEHRMTEGGTAELQKELGLNANQIPLALLRSAAPAPVETRAVTPAPADVGQNQSAIIEAVFPMSAAAFLGVDMPTVATGEAVFPVLTTSATVHTPAENAAAADTTGAFTASVLSPARLQAAFFYSREDSARFTGMGEALRANLSMALSDKLDQQIINGTKGLLNGTVLANHAAAAETDFEEYLSAFGWARVDGQWATGASDLRIVMGAGTYGHAGSVYAGTASNKGDLSALEKLMDISGGVRVSAHVPAVASNKQNAVIRLGSRRDFVAPIWEGVTLIPDEITKAANGQIMVTAVMLHAIQLLRAAGFYKRESQHA